MSMLNLASEKMNEISKEEVLKAVDKAVLERN